MLPALSWGSGGFTLETNVKRDSIVRCIVVLVAGAEAEDVALFLAASGRTTCSSESTVMINETVIVHHFLERRIVARFFGEELIRLDMSNPIGEGFDALCSD